MASLQDKVKKSPIITKDQPVSRQFERDYAHYYGWPYYWGFAGIWGMGAYPRALADSSLEEERKRHAETQNDPHLRSAKEVTGYHVHGSDGEVGHICDFIVDDETWTIRFLVIDTSNWWFGKKVLVAPQWAQSISWSKSMVNVSLTMEMIKNSPEWNPDRPVNREYEQRGEDAERAGDERTARDAIGRVAPAALDVDGLALRRRLLAGAPGGVSGR